MSDQLSDSINALTDRATRAETRVAELEAGIRRLCDKAKPLWTRFCTCPSCEDDESTEPMHGLVASPNSPYSVDRADLRALVGDETPEEPHP
jgi:hypothetical protein